MYLAVHPCMWLPIHVYWTYVGHEITALGEGNIARTVRDTALDTRAARSRLKPRGKPYYRIIEPGLHLGYRKPVSGVGKWVVRHYAGGQTYQVETVATADDFSDADGVAILSFRDAQAKARERMVSRAHTAAGRVGPITVADALDDYLDFLESNRKSAADARYRAAAFISPKLGEIEVAALTTDKIRKWHSELAKSAPRLRTKKGVEQKHRKVAGDDEMKRRRRATANRTLTVLKAALNRAWRDGKIESDSAWRRVEPFENVDAARVRYLTVPEAKRLINACEPDFRKLVQAGLQTGARYGELIRLQVEDFNSDTGTLAVRQSKTGKPRHVVLTEEGASFFRQLCAGRRGDALMLQKPGGGEWLKSHQSRPMREACERAKISPPISFHGLRHTWASLSVMAGVPLMVVAKNLGHSDTRMVERHYGHLAPNYIANAIRAGAPRFGFKPDKKVVSIGSQQ
jgi:integrase